MLEGRENIQFFWQGVMTIGFKVKQREAVEVESRGNLAYEVGRYILTNRVNGQEVNGTGKYVVVWKRQNGRWRMAVDIWNSSTPVSGQ